MNEIIDAFSRALVEAGLGCPDSLCADGRIHRFRAEGDRSGSRNAWYVLFPDGKVPAGAFGSWKLGVTHNWSAGGASLTERDRVQLRAQIDAARLVEQAARRAAQASAAKTAQIVFDSTAEADPRHPYLAAKRVKPHGVRQQGATLVIPLCDIDGVLRSIQTIRPDGNKRFLKGGRITGSFFGMAESPDGSRLLICEGFATGATLHEQTGLPVFCAMNCGNLAPVAMAVRNRYPKAEIVICGDNDHRTPGNPGLTAARKAALMVGGSLSIPRFSPGCPGTDWNDFYTAKEAA